MDKLRKLELIQRSLGIRHKLKVHESMKQPDTHEDMALMLITKWELEDELRAIEEILAEQRSRNVSGKKSLILKEDGDDLVPPPPGNGAGDKPALRKKTAKA